MSHLEAHVISSLRAKETTPDNNALHLLLWSAEEWRQVSLVVILSFNP